MFKDKNFIILFTILFFMPWIVLLFGIPAMICYMNAYTPAYGAALETFYNLAMQSGKIIAIIEGIFSIIGLIWLIINCFKKEKSSISIRNPLMLGVCSISFAFETLWFMLLVLMFTYAQSI